MWYCALPLQPQEKNVSVDDVIICYHLTACNCNDLKRSIWYWSILGIQLECKKKKKETVRHFFSMVYFYFAPHAYLTYSLSREHASFNPYLSTNCNLAIISQQIHQELCLLQLEHGLPYQAPHIRPQHNMRPWPTTSDPNVPYQTTIISVGFYSVLCVWYYCANCYD